MNNTCQFDQATCYLNHPAEPTQQQERTQVRREDFREARSPHPPDPARTQKPQPVPQQHQQDLIQVHLQQMTAAITKLAETQAGMATRIAETQAGMASSQATLLQAIQALLQKETSSR